MHKFFSNRTKIQKNSQQHPFTSQHTDFKNNNAKKKNLRTEKLSREGINCPKKGTNYPTL